MKNNKINALLLLIDSKDKIVAANNSLDWNHNSMDLARIIILILLCCGDRNIVQDT